MYGIGGVPDAWFDGWTESLGGLPSGSMFSYYNPIVTSHLGVVSPLEMTASFTRTGLDVTLDVHIDVTGFVATTSNRVHFIVCEDGGHNNVNMSRQALAYESFTLISPGQSVDIQRTTTLEAVWTGPINIIVFVQSHGTNTDVLQATLATEGWAGDTVGVTFGCTPHSGTLPFATSMWMSLENLTPWSRRISGRIDAEIANGNLYTNWRAGWTNLESAEVYSSNWTQNLPGLASLVGVNTFTLFGLDVTPAPYNQPPYAPDGGSDSQAFTITAYAP
jgi:hypothetical protein